MPIARLRRVDLTLMRSRSAADSAQVPASNARVDFYRQGATVKSASITLASGATLVPVEVYDVGKLVLNDTIMVEGRVALRVDAVDGPTAIKLTNTSGFTVRLYEGMRLIPATNRPNLYRDPFGTTTPLGSFLLADENGRVTGYIDEERYDYVTSPTRAPLIDAVATSTLTGSAATMSWQHAVGGVDRVLLVGVAWQSELEETLTGVTYAGIAMTPLGASQYVQVFGLVDPPRGTQDVVVTWSGSDHKGAIAGSVSLRGVNLPAPFGTTQSAQGTSTAPSVNVTGVDPLGVVFDTVGVNVGSGSVSLTVGAGQTQRWNTTAGSSSNLDLTRGGGSTEASAGAGSVTMSWTLGASKLWGIVGVEAKPAAVVVIDAEGSALVHAPFGINARDFQSLAEAVAALPAQGGEIFLPAGTYIVPTGGLLIDKPNVTLRGEGTSTVLTSAVANPGYHIIRVSGTCASSIGHHFRAFNLVIDGNATQASEFAGLWIHWPTPPLPPPAPQGCPVMQLISLENVAIRNAGKAGLWLVDPIHVHSIGCDFSANRGDGASMEFGAATGLTNIRFIGCRFHDNDGIGAVSGPTVGGGGTSFSFLACSFKDNAGGLGELSGNAISLPSGIKSVEVRACWVENTLRQGRQFIFLQSCDSAIVEGCRFKNPDTSPRLDRAVLVANSPGTRCANNIGVGSFETLIYIDSFSRTSIELCNQRTSMGPIATLASNARALGLSQGVISLFDWDDDDVPSLADLPAGSMIWIRNPPPGFGNLQVVAETMQGKVWKSVQLI